MEQAAVPATASRSAFRNGLGDRRRVVDPSGNETLEQLCLRSELQSVPSFEFALRERVSRLGSFRHEQFARTRSVERLSDHESTLAVVSERADGVRLSDLLHRAEQRQLGLDITAALHLIKQLVPAVAALHESAPELAHGAIAPERLVVTPDGRLVIVEYVLGAALEQLRYTRERYWAELRVALPPSAGLPRLDQRADVTGIGIVALSLILGRLMRDDEFPARIADVVLSTWAISPKGGFEPLPAGLRTWLGRALQLDVRSGFSSAIDARAELDKVLREGGDYIASSENLRAFLARYHDPTPYAPPARPPRLAPSPAPPGPSFATPSPLSTTATPPLGMPMAAVLGAPTPSQAASIPVVPGFWASTPPPPGGAPLEIQALADSVTEVVTTPARGTPIAGVTTPPRGMSSAAMATPPRGMSMPPMMTPPRGTSIPSVGASARGPATSSAPQPRAKRSFSMVRGAGATGVRPRMAMVRGVLGALLLIGAVAGWVSLRPTPTPVTDGTLAVSTNPRGVLVFVDGRQRGTTPVTLQLPAGPHKLELRSASSTRTIPIVLAAGTHMAQYIELPHMPADFGELQVRTEPPGARVSVNGTARGISPITIAQLAAGQHTVVLESDLRSVKQTVTIEPGMTAQLVVPLTAPESATASGWIAVSAPLELQLFEGDRPLGTSRSDQIVIPAGRHDIDLVNETFGYRATRSVQVAPGKVALMVVEMPEGTIALNAAPWAEVWIDGVRIGETPIGNHPLTIGTHDVVFRHPELGEQRHTAIVTLNQVARLSVDFKNP